MKTIVELTDPQEKADQEDLSAITQMLIRTQG